MFAEVGGDLKVGGWRLRWAVNLVVVINQVYYHLAGIFGAVSAGVVWGKAGVIVKPQFSSVGPFANGAKHGFSVVCKVQPGIPASGASDFNGGQIRAQFF